MDAIHRKQSLLFQALRNASGPTTAHQLSLVVGVSVRTIKTYISEINERIASTGFHICSKSREGYWIEQAADANEAQVLELFEEHTNDALEETPKHNYERINYIIKKLLVVDYHIKLEDLMDEIYVSRSTLTQDLKEVRKLLEKFRLKVIARANYGIIIEGNEIDKRLCIAEYFFHFNQKANYTIESQNMFNTGKNREEYDRIVASLKTICERYDCILSDFSLNNLAIHISIAMRRCTFYNYVKVSNETIGTLKDTVEFRAADALVKQLEQEFHCMLPIGETIYYAMHLQSKRIGSEDRMKKADKDQLEACIQIMLAEVKSNFELNLDQDKELYQYLFSHIPQMVRRLKNHMVIRNPLVYDNLRRYLFATKVTHSACAVISNIYHVDVDINEFGYLVLYFNLAITKYENRKRVRIGFVSGRGRPESIMYFNELQEFLSHERYEVIQIEKEEIINHTNLDFLVSTYMLPDTISIPCYCIQSDGYLEEIRSQLNHVLYKTLAFDKYFKPEYSYMNLAGSTKEEVLQNFYQLLFERGCLKAIPEDLTMRFKDDELGNGIVHFQDLYRMCRSEMCFIAVLNRPVLWNQDIVRVLILTKTKKDGDKDLPTLCRFVSRWANRTDLVEHLITTKDYQIFLQDIREE